MDIRMKAQSIIDRCDRAMSELKTTQAQIACHVLGHITPGLTLALPPDSRLDWQKEWDRRVERMKDSPILYARLKAQGYPPPPKHTVELPMCPQCGRSRIKSADYHFGLPCVACYKGYGYEDEQTEGSEE